MTIEETIRARFFAVQDHLNERGRRLLAAAEALDPQTSTAEVARATGLSRSTIWRGIKDLQDPSLLTGTLRRPGAGRPPLTKTEPTLIADLAKLVEPATLGDPMRPLLWVSKSHQKLAVALVPGTPDFGRDGRQVARHPVGLSPTSQSQDP